MKFEVYIIFLVLLMLSLPAKAQDKLNVCRHDTSVVTHSRIYYPVNKIDIYEDYMTNSTELENIKLHLQSSPRIDSITIYSYASPEGSYAFNKWLAAERGKTAKRYLLANVPKYREFPDSLIRLNPTAENWVGMREEIVSRYDLSDKDKVLEIIDREGVSDERRKQLIKALNGGRSWQYILKNIMPHLRYATWISVWIPVLKPEVTKNLVKQSIDSLSLLPPEPLNPMLRQLDLGVKINQKDTKTILALKTNMLYDALSWLNYSIEVPFAGDKFSVLAYHQFPWWTWGQNNNEYCIRFLGVGTEARWWFKPQPRPISLKKRDRLVGHFLGVYGESGKYDFERKTDICYQGEYWSVGLSYGFSFPISKWLNLELSVSGGYASIAYRGYTPSADYSVLWRDYNKIGRWHYFGPTKLQVSLVVPIVIKVKKGGSR